MSFMEFKNKKKVDSRIRFQHSSFKKKLQNARVYKRSQVSLPHTKGGAFFSKVGLNSNFSKFFALLILFFLVYLIYIPNFLFIKNISVNANGTNESKILKDVNIFLEKKLP